MQATINSDNTVTINVSRNELAILDYGLGYFAQHGAAFAPVNVEDIDAANALEQQLWAQYCKLVDQIQEQSLSGSPESREALWAHRQLTGE